MYRDLRIRNANRPTPIPPKYRAYVFRTSAIDEDIYKVIVAPSYIVACQRLEDFKYENDLTSFFWRFVAEDDFEVAYTNDVLPK